MQRPADSPENGTAPPVSVPSIGSKAVQPGLRPQSARPPRVSVPSIGSKAVQRAAKETALLLKAAFQYPLSGRRLCSGLNRPLASLILTCFSTLYRVEGCAAADSRERQPQLRVVSVPSIGSKAVQPGRAIAALPPAVGFSTLYRVEGCAAGRGARRRSAHRWFQYPLSGRRLCSANALITCGYPL